MPVKFTTQIASGPGENIYYVADSGSSPLDIFAAAAMYNKKRGYRFRPWTRRSGVGQYNANLIAYQPFMKADSLVEGSAAEFAKSAHEVDENAPIPEWERKLASSTAIIGGISAPAATYHAIQSVRQGKTGGFPRDVARGLSEKYKGKSKVAAKVRRAVKHLDKPMTPRAKALAALAGAGLVGSHAYTVAGDVAVMHSMHAMKPKKNEQS